MIVERIDRLAKSRNTTIKQVEKDLGFGNGMIGKWAKAPKSPPIDKLNKIANYFDVTLEYLIAGEARENGLPEKGAKNAPGQKAEGEMLDIETQRELVRQAISNTNDLGELLDMMDAINRKIRELK